MKGRAWLAQWARGDELRWFWRLYRWRRGAPRAVGDVLTLVLYRMARRHGGYIGRDAIFLGEPSLPHGLHGIYISRYAAIGRDCRIYQNVTIGEVNGRAPRIGDRCLIGAGAVVVGAIRVGNDVKIGAGAVVCEDIPDGCTVVPPPPRVLRRGGETP